MVVTLALVLAVPARAAEVTQVLDAFDGQKTFQGILGVRYVHTQRSALVLREWICQTNDAVDSSGRNPLCPSGNQVVDTRQLVYHEAMNVLNIDLRAGLWHDLELYLTLPLVMSSSTTLEYDDGVSAGNSLVDSDGLSPALFDVPYGSPSRAGFGDMTLGLKFAPFHGDRDRFYPSWVLGVEYQAPTGSTHTAGGSAVGSALHVLTLYTAISRRFMRIAEPYFKLSGTLRFADNRDPSAEEKSAETLYRNERETQTLWSPGHSLGLMLGTELYPWREPSEDQPYISVDVGFTAEFTFEGRETTELFDALGTSHCAPPDCGRTRYKRGETAPDGSPRRTDGVTDVEQYGRFGVNAGVGYQAMEHLRVRLGFSYRHTTSHFITFADAGRDTDGSGQVDSPNHQGVNEYNPFYNESYDDFGNRFRVDESNAYEMQLSIEGKL